MKDFIELMRVAADWLMGPRRSAVLTVTNHCDNDLYVSGLKEEVDRFIEVACAPNHQGTEQILSEEPFIPYPERFRKMDEAAREWERQRSIEGQSMLGLGVRPKDGFHSGGIDWCRENWGTKWGFYAIKGPIQSYNVNGTTVAYHFKTAWNPPLPLIQKMAEMFPALEFKLEFFERGRAFQGRYVWKGGELVKSKDEEYHGDRGG